MHTYYIHYTETKLDHVSVNLFTLSGYVWQSQESCCGPIWTLSRERERERNTWDCYVKIYGPQSVKEVHS
jgi:hypothetical protein